mgnify:CR=1 FL=1
MRLLLCCLLLAACKRSKNVEYTVLCAGEHNGNGMDYFQVITDDVAYYGLANLLRVSLPPVDFTSNQVVAVLDTARIHPLYQVGIAKITDEEGYVNVQVKRDYAPRPGRYAQAYVVACMPRIQKSVVFETLPFISEPFDADYIPAEGVSTCLNRVQAGVGQETLYFKFGESGMLWIEHRGMELNCAQTSVETGVRMEKECLYINEDERLGGDSVLALCTCAKNVGYGAGTISPKSDSLQVELTFSTLERGPRSRSFKIPAHGSVEVVIGERLWP